MRVTAIKCDSCKKDVQECNQIMFGNRYTMNTHFGWFDICSTCASDYHNKQIVFDIIARPIPLVAEIKKGK